jgi:hypothetical protein
MTDLSSSVSSPFYDEVHLLGQALGQVAHQAREAAEYLAYGHHAYAHDAFLQFAGNAAEVLGRAAEFGHVRLKFRLKGIEGGVEGAVFLDYLLLDFLDRPARRYGGKVVGQLVEKILDLIAERP